MLRVRLILLFLAMGLVSLRAGDGAPAADSTESTLLQIDRAEFTSALLAETNRARRAHGRRPLKALKELHAAADDQAAFLALTLTVQHSSFLPGQRTAWDRVARHGLRGSSVAENVASVPVGFEHEPKTAEEIAAKLVAQWLDSPGHRVNLLSRNVSHLGVAVRLSRLFGGQWAAYGVQVFFAPGHGSG